MQWDSPNCSRATNVTCQKPKLSAQAKYFSGLLCVANNWLSYALSGKGNKKQEPKILRTAEMLNGMHKAPSKFPSVCVRACVWSSPHNQATTISCVSFKTLKVCVQCCPSTVYTSRVMTRCRLLNDPVVHVCIPFAEDECTAVRPWVREGNFCTFHNSNKTQEYLWKPKNGVNLQHTYLVSFLRFVSMVEPWVSSNSHVHWIHLK